MSNFLRSTGINYRMLMKPDDGTGEGGIDPVVINPPSNPPGVDYEKINSEMESLKSIVDGYQTQFTTHMEQFKQQQEQFNNEKQKFQSEKTRYSIREMLVTDGLSGELVDFVYNDDLEIVKAKIETLKGYIKGEVDKVVNERFRSVSYTPPTNSDFNDIPIKSNKPSYMV